MSLFQNELTKTDFAKYLKVEWFSWRKENLELLNQNTNRDHISTVTFLVAILNEEK